MRLVQFLNEKFLLSDYTFGFELEAFYRNPNVKSYYLDWNDDDIPLNDPDKFKATIEFKKMLNSFFGKSFTLDNDTSLKPTDEGDYSFELKSQIYNVKPLNILKDMNINFIQIDKCTIINSTFEFDYQFRDINFKNIQNSSLLKCQIDSVKFQLFECELKNCKIKKCRSADTKFNNCIVDILYMSSDHYNLEDQTLITWLINTKVKKLYTGYSIYNDIKEYKIVK